MNHGRRSTASAFFNSLLGQFLQIFDSNMRLPICLEQAATDAKLVQFENALLATYTPGIDNSVAKQTMLSLQANRDVANALVACIISSDPGVKGDRGCNKDELSRSKTFADWLRPAGVNKPSDVTRVAFVR